MDKVRHVRIYGLHSWVGLVFGLLIYAIALSGCFALFFNEMSSWEDPSERLLQTSERASIDDPFQFWLDEQTGAGGRVDYVYMAFPNPVRPYYAAEAQIVLNGVDGAEIKKTVSRRWNAENAHPMPERGKGATDWVYNFHRELMWPDFLLSHEIGRFITGIAGSFLVLLILTGLVVHNKILPGLFTLRFHMNMRLRWQDTHKVFGLWGMPFYGLISITGAMMGLAVILAPLMAVMSVKGNTDGLVDAIIIGHVEPAGVEAQMLSLDSLGKRTDPRTGYPVAYIGMENWGDANARLNLLFETKRELSKIDPDTELAHINGYQLDGVSGERILHSRFEHIPPGNRFTNAIAPLHYGSYGGIAVKLLYFALGLSLAVMTALGLMLWVDRRRYGQITAGNRSDALYRRIGRGIVGYCSGLPLAILSIFLVDKIAPVSADLRLSLIGWTFFAAWGGAIGYAFLRRQDYRALRETLFASAGLAAVVPVIDFIVTGEFFLFELSEPHGAGWVNCAFLAGAVLLATATKYLPRQRS